MSTDELRAWLPPEVAGTNLAAELRRSRAFVQTGPDVWELAEWGGEPSSHLIRWRIPVDAAAIVGDEADAPSELAAALDLRPNRPVHVATRFGPITVAYDAQRVVRRTARPIILASGAKVGDVLIIVIDMSGTAAAVELERTSMTPG